MSISTGDVTLDSFRTREFNVNPSVAVENLRTHGHPSTFGGISIAAIDISHDFNKYISEKEVSRNSGFY